MRYTCTRKLMKMSRSSLVLTLPGFVVKKMNAVPGDTFAVVYDDELQTVTYSRVYSGAQAPRLSLNGETIQTELIP